VLPEPLRRVRAVLFGRDPDRRTLLYRTRQFLALLHACELEEFVTAVDPRVTYLPLDRGVLEPRPDVLPDDLGAVAARLQAVGEDALLALFGTSHDEPWATWRALWAADMPLPYRLGAVLLALAARTDEIRTGR
jgi:hypothetical protein